MKKIICLITCVLLLSSCATTAFVSNVQTLPKYTKTIDIYFGNQQIAKEYQVIGYVNASGWVFTSEKQLLKSLIGKAEELKADAIISVKYSYIPHFLIGIPYCEGVLISYK